MPIESSSAHCKTGRSALALALIVLLTTAIGQAPAFAKVILAAEGAAKVLCAGKKKTKHPKRTQLHHLVSPNVGASRVQMILQYEADDRGNPGLVMGEVTLVQQDDSESKVGEVGTLTDGSTGFGFGANTVPGDLSNAAAATWDIRFSGFKGIPARDCIIVLAGIALPSEGCGPYLPRSETPYTLPYRPGKKSVMSQGNCSPVGSHRYDARHAYDFALPEGTELLAIAATGNSGGTGGIPHLHLQLGTCTNRSICGTEPISFSNTSKHPNGLQVGKLYNAK